MSRMHFIDPPAGMPRGRRRAARMCRRILAMAVFGQIALPASAGDAPGQETSYEILGVRIPRHRVPLRHEQIVLREATESTPSLQEDRVFLGAEWAGMSVKYTRYRNAPARFFGSHPSLTTGGMGVGIGPSCGVWYLGDTTRIFINDRNIFAEIEAVGMVWESGHDMAGVRLEWEIPEADVSLHVAVPGDGPTAFVQYLVEPKQEIRSIRILLRCFPGAYAGGPEGLPSHRWIHTPSRSVEVRRGEPGRTLAFSGRDEWVFYADRYHDPALARGFGPAGLVLAPDQEVAGEVNVAAYGVDTWLICPPRTTRVRFALHAFPRLPNERALAALAHLADADRRALSALRFNP